MPFSECDNLMLATLSVYIACKTQNQQILYSKFQYFYFAHRSTYLGTLRKLGTMTHLLPQESSAIAMEIPTDRKLTIKEKLALRKAARESKEAVIE